jgi:arginyl-tRNA--protein-N-Asp/Glu arginylyltransferase
MLVAVGQGMRSPLHESCDLVTTTSRQAREQFQVSKADRRLPYALWLDEFTLLSKRKRREEYNNLFVNYCAKKQAEMKQ